ncbi:MAG: hypothetical protein P4L34_07475 [Paludibacter sp.]|nr:hypothetical protein [Paludibacter sp.]
MKTSNKLLLGLFVVVVIFILIIDITLKKKIDSAVKSQTKVEVNSPDSIATVDSDSIAMDKAIGNE